MMGIKESSQSLIL